MINNKYLNFKTKTSIFLGMILFISINLFPTYSLALTSQLNIYNVGNESKSVACGTLSTLDPTQGCGSGESQIDTIISIVVNILSIVVGVAAIIMLIVGGLKFVTSSGDSQKVASARNTIIYSLIGLVIVALAQTIVHFTITSATNTCPTNSSIPLNIPNPKNPDQTIQNPACKGNI